MEIIGLDLHKRESADRRVHELMEKCPHGLGSPRLTPELLPAIISVPDGQARRDRAPVECH